MPRGPASGAADVEFAHVDKRYRVYRERYRSLKEIAVHRRFGEWEDRWALRDVSFSIAPGEIFGLIGPNGAGKSTSLKLMARILVPEAGEVHVRRRVAGLLELGAGFQPEYSGRENVSLNASLLGLSRRQIEERYDSIVAFAELEEAMDSPLATYSTGMQMRLGFSVATHVDADILLVDEILAVGDESFQHKCYEWLQGFHKSGGTIVIVSHNLSVMREMCDRVAWIDAGQVRQIGNPNIVVGAYLSSIYGTGAAAEGQPSVRTRGEAAPSIELKKPRLLDSAGRPATEIAPGQSLAVEIDFEVNKPLRTPVFGVAIYTLDGTCIYATNNAEDGVRLEAISAPGTVRVEYPELNLLPGEYQVAASVFSAPSSSTMIDSVPELATFRVDSRTKEAGIARFEHRWSQTTRPGPKLATARTRS